MDVPRQVPLRYPLESDATQPIAPRLELSWAHDHSNSQHDMVCTYSLVLPLGRCDIRRELEGGKTRDEMYLEIGVTRCTGRDTPIHGNIIDTPFRDGAHARWDSMVLGDIPVVVRYKDMWQYLSFETPKDHPGQKSHRDLAEQNSLLSLLCRSSLHLLRGAEAIYDPQRDVGPTHWLQTRDELLKQLDSALG